jgi:hypothetical protein
LTSSPFPLDLVRLCAVVDRRRKVAVEDKVVVVVVMGVKRPRSPAP